MIELYAQQAGVVIRECFPDSQELGAEVELVGDMLAVVVSRFAGAPVRAALGQGQAPARDCGR